jgi:AmmeMemoRadiSam system protein B
MIFPPINRLIIAPVDYLIPVFFLIKWRILNRTREVIIMQITVRKPAVAGLFYPESQRECRAMVDRLLIENPCEQSFDHIKGVVVPHAGYVYSGAVAAKAFNLLSKQAQQFNKVVLLGPSHRVPLMGMSFSHFDAFHTPLGNVPLAVEEIHRLSEKHHIPIDELPHEYEHSLEV